MKNLSKKLSFSFDIGYASIGWSVIEYENDHNTLPNVIGTGVVTFEADSCLASARREFRRTRRTIRSRRKRIERIGKILIHNNIINADELALPGHPSPFLLAARALQGKQKLNGIELWHVLRWYAHNRGYDGNKQWARTESDEDAERVTLAKNKMAELGTTTMAETVSAILGIDTNHETARFTINSPKYKNLNLAFPRNIIEAEVNYILTQACNINSNVINLIIGSAKDYKSELETCGIRFPLRFDGSILFGQLMPRFDNRIIARCPITWASTYRKAIESGETHKKAKQLAEKYAKVPNKNCAEFYEYRFARILANIRVNDEPIAAETRQFLMQEAKNKGRFTKTEFSKLVAKLTNNQPNNLHNYFHLTPDAEEALIVVPQTEKQQATGRAPYARPVLRQVVEEILRGEDTTKPAKSLLHPNGEDKKEDGTLYCLANPESEVSKYIANRSIDEQTNNHLVRHRMLIFGRLLKDMIAHYAQGDPNKVATCCIEVNRELREFSGLKNEEISKILNKKKEHFNSAKKKLADDAPNLPVTGGLIRKCRIAMDLKWTCPYTGMKYSAQDLPNMEKEHIVPFASRNSNALSSLVLTYPEVNAMKGKRTGLQFIKEEQGNSVPGRSNLSIITESLYKKFVDKLDKREIKDTKDDEIRKAKRKKLLLVDDFSKNGEQDTKLGFTEGQLTQSSQLMRLSAQVIKKQLHNTRIISIPGQVTAETRKAWKLMGTLSQAVPEIIADNGEGIKEKDEIRSITHLHHAVDACTLGLIPLLIPSGDNGRIWRLILQRRISDDDMKFLKQETSSSIMSFTNKNAVFLKDVPTTVKDSMANALLEYRVIRHIPADMSGAKLLSQYKGVYNIQDYSNTSDTITLRSRNKKTGKFETKSISKSKVIGLNSTKLKKIKSVIPIEHNYGIVLAPKPTIIRHCSVFKQIAILKRQNCGKPIRILKPGVRIKISNHTNPEKNKVWSITSVQEDKKGKLILDLSTPDYAKGGTEKSPKRWRQVAIDSLLKIDFDIIPSSYIGNLE